MGKIETGTLKRGRRRLLVGAEANLTPATSGPGFRIPLVFCCRQAYAIILRPLRPSPLSLIESTHMVSLSARIDYSQLYLLLFLRAGSSASG